MCPTGRKTGTRVWAPRLHDLLGGGGLREEYPPRVPPASFITKRDQDRDEGQDASPLERFPKIRTDEAEAGEGGADSTSASSFSAGAPPRTRVVAYLRRDLCALVAFREGGEREQRCACAERGNVGEVAFARDGSNGGSGTSGRRPSGARRSCYACSRENWGWSDAEVGCALGLRGSLRARQGSGGDRVKPHPLTMALRERIVLDKEEKNVFLRWGSTIEG